MAVSDPSVKGTLTEWAVSSLLLAPSFYLGFVEPTLLSLASECHVIAVYMSVWFRCFVGYRVI